ncbi:MULTISPECIES: site-specific integrase [unclassified Pseudoalteromonas]|uniref:site-specific integrase n=1 Tax=Pseudoalteromonas sp. TB64 TaxID=1938600 RepID=UPI0003F73532|nr:MULTISPECIES: site-specific integrase [unclassified Pseudoalteromonas]
MEYNFENQSFFAKKSKTTKAISFNNFEFDYLDDTWILSRNITLSVAKIDKFKVPLCEDILETLVYFAENFSAGYTQSLMKSLNAYQKHTGLRDFTELGLVTFYNLAKNGAKSNKFKAYVSQVRCFIKKMRFLGLASHIDESIFKLIDGWRIGGNDKGIPVLTLDPETGPYSDLEFDAIGHHAAHKYAEGKLSLEEYMTITLFKASGRRPDQLASTKHKDFFWSNTHSSISTYIGNIPRAKQIGEKFRASLTPFAFTIEIGRVIEKYIKEQTQLVEKILGRKLTDEQKGELPLFIAHDVIKEMKHLSSELLFSFLKSELLHIKNIDLSSNLRRAIKRLNVISERTGEPIHSTGYRFRYSMGTRAAREGAGVLTIARILDHSNTQNVGVYVKNIPEFAIEVSKIMNQSLAKYASAFAGQIVADEDEANGINPGAARIPCRDKDCDIGSCGTNAFCQDYAPIACYLCPKFKPWANAPHHLVLEWLVEERERLKKDAGGDMQIVTINDRAILAVCQVIEKCREYNNA